MSGTFLTRRVPLLIQYGQQWPAGHNIFNKIDIFLEIATCN